MYSEIFTPQLWLALAKVTALLLITFALAPLIKNPSLRASLWTVSLLALPAVFALSFSTPLLSLIPQPAVPEPVIEETPLVTTLPKIPEANPLPDSENIILSEQEIPEETSTTPPVSRTPFPWLPIIYGIGVFLTLLPWLLSTLKLRLLPKYHASDPPLSFWNSIHTHHSRIPSLKFTPSPAAPFTCGIIKPSVLLPEESTQWSQRRIASTLLHEAAHLRRRDPLTRFLSSLVRAAFWFHPLAWLAHRQLISTQEQACDQHALIHGIKPADYAEDLLASASHSHLTPSQALSMARWSQLGNRIRCVLQPKAIRPATKRQLSALMTLMITSQLGLISIGFAQATPEKSSEKTPALPASFSKLSITSKGEMIHSTNEGVSETIFGGGFFIKLDKASLTGSDLLMSGSRLISPFATNFKIDEEIFQCSGGVIGEEHEGSITWHLADPILAGGVREPVSEWMTYHQGKLTVTPPEQINLFRKRLTHAHMRLNSQTLDLLNPQQQKLLRRFEMASYSLGDRHPVFVALKEKINALPPLAIIVLKDGSSTWRIHGNPKTYPPGTYPAALKRLVAANPNQKAYFTSTRHSRHETIAKMLQKLGIKIITIPPARITLAVKLGFPLNAEDLFQKYDLNGDFQISKQEFISIGKGGNLEDFNKAFQELDKNKNLRLVLSELFAAYRVTD